MRSWLASILVFLVSTPLLAQTAKPQTSTTTTTTTTTTVKPKTAPKKRAAATPKAPAPTSASEIKTLREAVSTQQQQIQMLRDELQRRDAAMQQVQQQLNSLQSTAQQAQSAAQSAASASERDHAALMKLESTVSTVQTTATTTATNLQAAEKSIKGLESPLAIKYKGITITPGGFISANGIYRTHNQNLSNASSFTGIPFSGSTNSHLSELRLNSRYSRLSLLAEGKTKTFSAQAYYEIDFEGAAQTANESATNSFTPRMREAWVNVDGPNGVSFAGGQTWNLLTPNRSGIGPRGLMLPAHLDASLTVGFHYAREGTFRVYKNFNKKVFLAFSVENPETTSTGSTPAGLALFGLQASTGQPSATVPNSAFAAGLSVDQAPDLAGKIAFEPGWGHFEIGAIGRFFRVRRTATANTGTNNAGIANANDTNSSVAGAFNAVLPVVPKKLDIVWANQYGRGIGRFGPGGGIDVTIKPDATLMPILGYQGYLGFEAHPNPKWDLLLYLGDEYYQRTQYITGGTATAPTGFGYGFIGQGLGGCRVEVAAATGNSALGCTASTRNIYEITPGFWYRFYKGPAGTIQYGMFWEYVHRSVWTGRMTTTPAVTFGAPVAIQNEIIAGFRWYFP